MGELEHRETPEPDGTSRLEERDDEAEPVVLVVRATLTRRLGELGIGALFAAITTGMIVGPAPSPSMRRAFVTFCGLGAVHFLGRALDRRPRLVLDGEGVTDRTSMIGGALRVEWSEVTGVATLGLSDTVRLQVRDWKTLRRRAGPVRRLWMWITRLLGRDSIAISPAFLGMNQRELGRRVEDALFRFERAQVLATRNARGEVGGGTGEERRVGLSHSEGMGAV